jgi:Icc-related predicted phosphoesterase
VRRFFILMHLIFATDIHHDFERFRALLEKTSVDLYLFGGDLVYRAFHRHAQALRFVELEQVLRRRLDVPPEDQEDPGETLFEKVRSVTRQSGESGHLDQARQYLALCRRAEKYLLRSYEKLNDLLESFREKEVYLVPGNYDMDLARTALRERNLHLSVVTKEGLRIAGFGGARAKTPGIPDHLQAPYGETQEARQRLDALAPDILLLHEPPYGYLDLIPHFGHGGSHWVRQYMEAASPKLILCGHYHEDWGVVQADRTVLVNPSNFGHAVGITRDRPGGYFIHLRFVARGLAAATLSRVERGGIFDILEYGFEDGRIKPIILDEKRYRGMGGRLPPTHHIAPLRRLNQIKGFFLKHETAASATLIRELRSVYRDIRSQGMEVAFDLLGSLNFGQAVEGSDMDVVVYLRARDCTLDEEDTCQIPRPLAAVFKALEKRKLPVEVCDSVDLDRVKRAIQNGDATDAHLQRFVFYRTGCRPVNLKLVKDVENLLLSRQNLRRAVEKELKGYLDVLISTTRHTRSFEKYRQRLEDQGIHMPQNIENAIRAYLQR